MNILSKIHSLSFYLTILVLVLKVFNWLPVDLTWIQALIPLLVHIGLSMTITAIEIKREENSMIHKLSKHFTQKYK